jgi:hypothetical protein
MPLHEIVGASELAIIYSFVNPNSEKSAEVQSEYPIYISRFGPDQRPVDGASGEPQARAPPRFGGGLAVHQADDLAGGQP